MSGTKRRAMKSAAHALLIPARRIARPQPLFRTGTAERRDPGRRGVWSAGMKQASSRELFGYWAARRGTRTAPERGEIEPSAIRRALGDVFILEFDRGLGHPFRLAGTRVCALFGRELKNQRFIDL